MIQIVIRKIPKITVELFDDAESTPGISRQQTRFIHEVKEELEQIALEREILEDISIGGVTDEPPYPEMEE